MEGARSLGRRRRLCFDRVTAEGGGDLASSALAACSWVLEVAHSLAPPALLLPRTAKGVKFPASAFSAPPSTARQDKPSR